MADFGTYVGYLLIHLGLVVAFFLIISLVLNLIFLALKLCKVFHQKRVWILTNLVLFAILIALVVPVCVDIVQTSFVTISDVVNIDDLKTNKIDYISITDSSGEVYTCYGYFVDTESITDRHYPGTALYAKHSKLLLDYIPGQ